jgi:signal transduction histidine kinase
MGRLSNALAPCDLSRIAGLEKAGIRVAAPVEGNVAKSACLANILHEIRTPLNANTGTAYVIGRSGVTPEQANRLDKVDNAGQHLLESINAILDLAKIEAGKFVVEAAKIFNHLLGDPTKLHQALLNYATNAIKFTETGTVILRSAITEDSDDSVLVRFEVEDTGIGIDTDALPKLFSAFEQADNSMTRKYGGTGLGLTITRKLAQLMGGDAGVISAPGAGSTFWLRRDSIKV